MVCGFNRKCEKFRITLIIPLCKICDGLDLGVCLRRLLNFLFLSWDVYFDIFISGTSRSAFHGEGQSSRHQAVLGSIDWVHLPFS